MIIEVTEKNNELMCKLNGRLDSVSAGELEQKLAEAWHKDITALTFDFRQLDYISSKGLRVLVAAYRKLQGQPLHISGANQTVQEVLRLSGLLNIFSLE